MISKMDFGVRQVREFLAANGCVLTVRGYDYTTTAATVPQLNDVRIIRSKVCEITTIDDLNGFVTLSGFKTVSEWWIQIKRFCKGRMWLYRVQIDDNHISKMETDYEKRERQQLKNVFHAADREFAETHPLDIRHESRDPADLDLQPFKDAAHADRIRREERATQRRHEAMRKKYQDHGEIKTIIKAPRKQDILMITGNRRLQDPVSIKRQLSDLIDERRPDAAISGMAIGADQLFAEICIEKGIPLHAYIPFLGQEKRWSASMKRRYRDILSHCEKKVIVCDSASIQAFQTRNVAMVNASKRAIAVRDYKPGGTENCIGVLDRESKPYVTVKNETET